MAILGLNLIDILPGVSDVLDAESIIGIFFILRRLDVDPALCQPHPAGFGVFDDGRTSALGLHVCLKLYNYSDLVTY